MVAVIELRASQSLATAAVNVWHCRIPEANVNTEVAAAISALDTFYEAIKARIQITILTVEGLVRTVDKNPNVYIGGSGLTTSTTGPVGGSLATAVCMSMKSSTVGGSHRGRKYLGPCPASVVNTDGRTVASAVVTEILNAGTVLLGTSTAGIDFGIWSRQDQVFTSWDTVSVNPVLATQRRRLT